MKAELLVLVRQAQSGNLQAFEGLLREFQGMAVAYAYSLLGDFHLAEDAAQEAFVAAYQGLSTLKDARAFPGWLRTIVFRACGRMRKFASETVPLDPESLPSQAAGPGAEMQQQEMEERVRSAVDRLPEKERDVMTLYYISGHSHREISGFLGVPEGTIKSRLHSGRKRLRKGMMKMAGDTMRGHRPKEEFTRKVLTEVIARYGLSMSAKITGENPAPKSVYDERHLEVTAGGARYLLKQHADYLDEGELRIQRRLAELLKGAGMEIVLPAQPLDQADHPRVGNKLFTLFPEQEGRPLWVDTVEDLQIAAHVQGKWIECCEQLRDHPEWEQIVGEITRTRSRGWTRVAPLDRLGELRNEWPVFQEARERCESAIPESLQALFLRGTEDLESEIARLESILLEKGVKELPHTIVHGFLCANYIILTEDRAIVGPDLYCATYDLRIADFARMADFAENPYDWVDLSPTDKADLFRHFQRRARLLPDETEILPFVMCANRLQYEIGHVNLCIREGDSEYKQGMIDGIHTAVTKAREYLTSPRAVLQDYGI